MIEIRFHGRGGQGAVVGSNILAEGSFKEGKYVQAFPFFGIERRGAPILSFTRIDEKAIRIKNQIYNPDCIVVLDPTLIDAVDVTSGLKENGLILLNTDKNRDSFSFRKDFKLAVINASGIARRLGLGVRSSPIVNTAILGAFSKFTGFVGIESVLKAINEKVPLKQKENKLAAKEAYEKVLF